MSLIDDKYKVFTPADEMGVVPDYLGLTWLKELKASGHIFNIEEKNEIEKYYSRTLLDIINETYDKIATSNPSDWKDIETIIKVLHKLYDMQSEVKQILLNIHATLNN